MQRISSEHPGYPVRVLSGDLVENPTTTGEMMRNFSSGSPKPRDKPSGRISCAALSRGREISACFPRIWQCLWRR